MSKPILPRNMRIEELDPLGWVEIEVSKTTTKNRKFAAFVSPNQVDDFGIVQSWQVCSDIIFQSDDGFWEVMKHHDGDIEMQICWESKLQLNGFEIYEF